MHPFDPHAYFFDGGLRFACQRCGACCSGDPGIVQITSQEIAKAADYLGISPAGFIDGFCLPWKDRHRIREDNQGNCLFHDNGCRIYPMRPLQCRTFPFWFSNLRSQTRWESIRRQCPGIGRGRRYSKKQILDILQHSM